MNSCCFAPPSTMSVLSVYRPIPSFDPCPTPVPFFFLYFPHFFQGFCVFLLLGVSILFVIFPLTRLFGATLCIGPSHRDTESRLHRVDPLGLACPGRGIYVCVVCVLCYFIPCLVTILHRYSCLSSRVLSQIYHPALPADLKSILRQVADATLASLLVLEFICTRDSSWA